MTMEASKAHMAHCLLLAYPAQGHATPLFQFSKRLQSKGVKVTFVSTFFFCNNSLSIKNLPSNITLETISDGYDTGGWQIAESFEAYNSSFKRVGSRTLAELLQKLNNSSRKRVDCIVYDSHLPWVLDVAKAFGVFGAPFLTQPCAVGSIYYHAQRGLLKLPLAEEQTTVVSLPGLPQLAPSDLPSFLYKYGSYPVFLESVLGQFSNIDEADWVLANTFYELEREVVEWMKKMLRLKTIGPTVPSMLLDRRIQDDTHYGISMFKPSDEVYMKWLDDKPKQSVVYVSYGSLANLSENQMEEIALALIESEYYFLWVVRESEESKLPKDFKNMASEKGIIVTWCLQLQVLSHESVGCFLTHCGWNSTLEGLSLGVPLVGLPQWTDQNTNAKFISDVWEIGVTACVDERGCFTRQEVKRCLKEIMEGERGNEIRNNVKDWRIVAKNAVDEGGSSDKNLEEFVAELVARKTSQ